MITVRVMFVTILLVLGFFIGSLAGGWVYGLIAAGCGFSAGAIFMLLEINISERISTIIYPIFFGIVVGCVFGAIVIQVLDLIPMGTNIDNVTKKVEPAYLKDMSYGVAVRLLVLVICSYLSIGIVERVRKNFKVIIPFIELEEKGAKISPVLLDTSVIIDGRIADIFETRILDNPVIIPRFILDELHQVADSPDKLKRKRGRRGLDMLNKLRQSDKIDLTISEISFENMSEPDAMLIKLAKQVEGRVITTDFNLNKIAQLQGVEVININDLSNAMRPQVLPGEVVRLKLLRAGEEAEQGVGYLDDGTMVVCEHGKDLIGKTVTLTVTSVIQTSAGRMVFGRVNKGE